MSINKKTRYLAGLDVEISSVFIMLLSIKQFPSLTTQNNLSNYLFYSNQFNRQKPQNKAHN